MERRWHPPPRRSRGEIGASNSSLRAGRSLFGLRSGPPATVVGAGGAGLSLVAIANRNRRLFRQCNGAEAPRSLADAAGAAPDS